MPDVEGVKRSIGTLALEVFNLMQLQLYLGASSHTLRPTSLTWSFFVILAQSSAEL